MSKSQEVNIDWNYSGKFNFIGTGATRAEEILSWAGSFIIPIFVLYLYFTGKLDWNLVQIIVAVLIAFDLSGGIIANSLNCCKRLYNSPLKDDEPKWVGPFKNHIIFSSFHIHPIIIGLLYDNLNWVYGIIWYALLMISVVIVEYTPLYLKRPVSMTAILLAIMLGCYVITPITGFEWFIPVLFLKIVYGHAVREEPYRPATSET